MIVGNTVVKRVVQTRVHYFLVLFLHFLLIVCSSLSDPEPISSNCLPLSDVRTCFKKTMGLCLAVAAISMYKPQAEISESI